MIELIVVFCFFAFLMEVIDSSIGMGYGTVLSPLLLALGIQPLIVVPSILISQAIGGLVASIRHQFLGNFDIKKRDSRDYKTVVAITVLGLLGTVIGCFVAFNIPKFYLKTYIGLIVLLMGTLMLLNKKMKFSYYKMYLVGLFASFNKAVTGGGFGPVTTGGQVVSGNGLKSSVGVTTASEVLVCLIGFFIYVFINGFDGLLISFVLCVGAFIGALVGPLITKKLDQKTCRVVVSVFMLVLGLYTILKVIL